ncbi:MAG: FMN-binding negative transcriptional regulator [Gammaproteobacteria bacterium]|nr:FMN-binding negative transcriptional regulator [Gammaproteobacteria bacterium]
MFTPRVFRVDDTDQLVAFMRRYSFCTLITPAGDDVSISHVPILVEKNDEKIVLVGHLARANPHGAVLNANRSTAIFHGPHSYVSPAWYADSHEVPTWNYAAVHAAGVARTFSDAQRLSSLVDRMIETYEALHGAPWDRQLTDEYRNSQLSHITGFEIVVEKLNGKFKLGQNRSQSDQDSMLIRLTESSDDDSRELAEFIRQYRRQD